MNNIRPSRSMRHPAALGVLILTALVWALPSAADAVPNPPQLSITVDDGQATTAPSANLTYAVAVTNLGSKTVQNLVITQTVPEGAELDSTTPKSTEKAGTLTWSVDVKPGKTATMETTLTVAKTMPDGLLRLATVACARTSAQAAPLVCAADSDQLPAGAVADEQRREMDESATDAGGWWPLPGTIVLGGVLLALVFGGLLLLRRRGRGQHPGGPGPDANNPADLVSSSHL